MKKIEHVVFDIGNVLIQWDCELAFLEQIPDAVERRWFLDNICDTAWNIEQDRGRDWGEAEELLIAQYPEHESNIRTFRANWNQMVSGEVPGSVAILERLVEHGHDVTMLTNFASDTFKIAQERFEFLAISRGVTVSAEIGLIKPDAAIFHHHVKSFALTPENCLFIDDSEKNVQGAIDAGWQSIHFTNAQTLKADLERLGVEY